MFVRRLVTGVRSSCEASATSWRCAWTEASSALIECSSASSIALKLVARRPISSSPVSSIRPLRSWVQRDVLGRLGEALQRQHGGAGDQPSEQRRERDPADVEQREDQAQAAEQAVDFGQRLGVLDGAPGAERLGEDAQVRCRRRWRRVKNDAPPLPPPARACAASTGSEMSARRAHEDRALRAHHLLVAAHLVGFGREVAEGVVGARARPAGPVGAAAGRRASSASAPGPLGGVRAEGQPERRAAGVVGIDAACVEEPQQPRGLAPAVAQLRVDLAVQLVGGEQVGEQRREHHGDRHRGGRDEGDAPAEAHAGPPPHEHEHAHERDGR